MYTLKYENDVKVVCGLTDLHIAIVQFMANSI